MYYRTKTCFFVFIFVSDEFHHTEFKFTIAYLSLIQDEKG